jgi:hypothetical protein
MNYIWLCALIYSSTFNAMEEKLDRNGRETDKEW